MREDIYDKQITQLPNRRMLMLIFVVCSILAHIVCAQSTRIPITPEPVGSGARALGQSAFIAVADDATAASWNPAGLINLEMPEASFVGVWKTISKDYSSANPNISINRDSWNEAEINFMSYAYPLQVGNTDIVISANYHQVYDLGVEFNGLASITPTLLLENTGKSEGAIAAYTLAGGLSIPDYPELAIGASFNWYAQSLLNDYAWQVKQTGSLFYVPGPTLLQTINSTETYDEFQAHNFTFGLLWDIDVSQENLLTLGFVYHTPFTAKVDQKLVGTSVPGVPFASRGHMKIEYPPSFGAGANYRFSDEFSMAFDVEWKEWSEFKQKYPDGTSISPIDKDTMTYRLGFEKLSFSESARESVIAYRGGLFYEPRPVSPYRDPLSVYGLSTGLGWTVKKQFSLDFAYQFRWGEGDDDSKTIEYDIKEHLFVASLIIYF